MTRSNRISDIQAIYRKSLLVKKSADIFFTEISGFGFYWYKYTREIKNKGYAEFGMGEQTRCIMEDVQMDNSKQKYQSHGLAT